MLKKYAWWMLFAFLSIQDTYSQQPEAFAGVWIGDVIRNDNAVGKCRLSISAIHSVQTFAGNNSSGKCTIDIELFNMVDNQRNSKQSLEGEYLSSGNEKHTELVSFKISVPDVEYKQIIKGEINLTFEATDGQHILNGSFYPNNIFSKKNFGFEKWILFRNDTAHSNAPRKDTLNSRSTIANNVGDTRGNDTVLQRGNPNATATTGDFVMGMPDNEIEASYFTAETENEKFTISSSGKIIIQPKIGKPTNFSMGIGPGNSISKIYTMKYANDIICGYEMSDGEYAYTYLSRINIATGNVKWKKSIPGINVFVSSGFEDQWPFLYIGTDDFIGKLNLNKAEYSWKHSEIYKTLKISGAGFESITVQKDRIILTGFITKKKTILDKHTGRLIQ